LTEIGAMVLCSRVSKTGAKAATSKELRGSVLDVLRDLLQSGRDDEVLALVAKLVMRNQELELLLTKLRESKNRGEHVSAAQLDLFLNKLREQAGGELGAANQALEAAAKENGGREEPKKPPKQPAVRRPPPPGARRVHNPIAVPDAERPCPVCSTARTCICHETTEVIELIPAEVIIRLDQREILACPKCEAELVRAPMGDKVVEGGAYGSRLVSELVVNKYWDGLPLNRQAQQLERLGLSMPSSSMADQITWATDLLRPLWHHLIAAALAAVVMHIDGTSMPVRDRDSPLGIQTGSLWGYVGDTNVAVYLYTSTGKKLGQRAGEIGPSEFLAMRRGPVVADAANLFDTSFESSDRIEVGCNMHARRYFVKALDAGDHRAAVPIAAFRTLYDVEDSVRDADPEQRHEERQRRAKPVYDELARWCTTYQPLEPPTSLLGAAIRYLLNHRIALTRFLDDARLPIDNGIVERLHRRPAIGRRNYLFAGSHAGAERGAIAYSVLGTCALVDVNPTEYLADILPALARGAFTRDDLKRMLPAAWKAARAASQPCA
jgi:transposase